LHAIIRHFFLLFVIMACIPSVVSCGSKSRVDPRASPALAKLETKWNERAAEFDKVRSDKDVAGARAQAFDDLIHAQTSESRRAIADEIAIGDDHDFSYEVLPTLARSLIDHGERETLVALISRRCPQQIGSLMIEHYLMLREPPESSVGLGVLEEAFERSPSAAAKNKIAQIIRRAFETLPISDDNDAAFIHLALNWYSDHKDEYELNLNYEDEMWGKLEAQQEGNPPKYAVLFIRKGTQHDHPNRGYGPQ
jgi:hypothetical protein